MCAASLWNSWRTPPTTPAPRRVSLLPLDLPNNFRCRSRRLARRRGGPAGQPYSMRIFPTSNISNFLNTRSPPSSRQEPVVGNLAHLASAFLELAHLRPGDRAAQLDAIVKLCASLTKTGDAPLGARLAVTLAQFASTPDWLGQFDADLKKFVRSLLLIVSELDLCELDINEDFFTYLIAHRVGASGAADRPPELSLSDLASDHWPIERIDGTNYCVHHRYRGTGRLGRW